MAEGNPVSPDVEPLQRAGTTVGEAGHTHEGNCLNCGTKLQGTYCHACGQHAHVHKTAGAFLHDLLHGALHWEGKTWHTLPLLAARPGELTRRYIHGERARFVSPMALFLFSVFLMFAVFQIAGISAPSGITPGLGAPEGIGEARQEIAERRELIEDQLAALPADAPARADLEAEQARLEQASGQVREIGAFLNEGNFEEEVKMHTGSAFLDKGIAKFRDNPALMLYKLQANSYKFSWLLIPLSIPFMMLLFAWRRRFGAYDHAVFVTYSLSFMTLFFVILTVLAQVGFGEGWLLLVGTVIPLWHIYRQLKGAYGLTHASALWRMLALSMAIGIIIVLFVNLLLLLGFFG